MRHFAKFVTWYLKLKPIEKTGRIYEVQGYKWLDKQLCKVFGTVPIERYSPGKTESFDRLVEVLHQGRYMEVVNAMSVTFYSVYVFFFFKDGYTALAWWTVVMMLSHFITLPIERYKRALIIEWLKHPEVLTDPEPGYPEPRSIAQLNHWFYKPRGWESEKSYEKLGVQSFRTFVNFLTRLSEPDLSLPQPKYKPNTLKSTSYPYLDSFESSTRSSEFIHWLGVIQHIPHWIVFIPQKYWIGLLLEGWLLYLNVFAGMLQRQHRSRMFKLLMKKAINKQASNQTA